MHRIQLTHIIFFLWPSWRRNCVLIIYLMFSLTRKTKDFSKPVGFKAHVEHPFLSLSALDAKLLSNSLHSKPMHHHINTIHFKIEWARWAHHLTNIGIGLSWIGCSAISNLWISFHKETIGFNLHSNSVLDIHINSILASIY